MSAVVTTLDAERWRQLRGPFEQALELDGAARDQFLDELRTTDPSLHAGVEDLLAAADSPALSADESLLEAAASLAAQSVADNEKLDESRVGSSVGPYRLLKLIGTGGVGAVYLAESVVDGLTRQVALKVVRGGMSHASAHERFERERHILAALIHPQIATFLDGGQTLDGERYYTMEYVDGVPIAEFCAAREPTVRGRVRLLQQVAAALAYAHVNLVVHRDIKPSNVLVRADKVVKLVDFGIAKLIGAERVGGPAITDLGRGPMTPEYAAPEQFRRGAISVATDVYQFGCLCYRVVSGKLPYRADPHDAVAWARAVCEEEPLRLPHGDLDAILRKAMAKSPGERYRSIDAMAADLEAYLDGRPVSARRAGFWYFAWRFVARRPYAVGGATVAIVALALTAIVALGQARLARSEAVRAKSALAFVNEMFKVADPGGGRAKELTAHMILERGTQRLHHANDPPALHGSLALMIGNVYVSLGDMKNAMPLMEEAIEGLTIDAGGERLALPIALERGAFVALRAGRAREALAWLDEAERLLGAPRAESADLWSEILSDRFTIAFESLEPEQALRIAERAVKLAEQHDREQSSARTALALQHLSYALTDVGRPRDAIPVGERAAGIFAALYGPEDLRSVRADEGIVYALVDAGQYAEAQGKLDRAERAYRGAVGEQSYRYAVNLYNRSRLLRARGEADAAREALLKAARIVEEVSAPNAALRGRVLYAASSIEREQGKYEEALTHLGEVDRIWTESLLPESAARIGLALDRAACFAALGHLDAARRAADVAVTSATRGLPSTQALLTRAMNARVALEKATAP